MEDLNGASVADFERAAVNLRKAVEEVGGADLEAAFASFEKAARELRELEALFKSGSVPEPAPETEHAVHQARFADVIPKAYAFVMEEVITPDTFRGRDDRGRPVIVTVTIPLSSITTLTPEDFEKIEKSEVWADDVPTVEAEAPTVEAEAPTVPNAAPKGKRKKV